MDPLAEKYYSVSPYAYCENNPVNRIDPTGMDWIEKDGHVEWRPDATQDNTPKGWNYVGKEYQGVAIEAYSDFKGKSGTNYLTVRIGYKDPNSKEGSYNWVQTVERDKSGEPFVDTFSKEGAEGYPYYQDKAENEDSRNKNGYDITYFDRPNETHDNGSFNAELSLIGAPLGTQACNQSYPTGTVPGKNIYVPKITLQYGFSVTNGKMTASPIRVVVPSPYHKQTINKIK